MTRTLLAALALTGVLAAPAAAFDPAAMSEAEKAAFGEAVREYLMANPEVLIESINVLEERRMADEAENDRLLVAHFRDQLVNDGHSWVAGNPDASLTIVEFMDYRCGFCRQVHPQVVDLIASDKDVRVIIKEFPILGEESELASRFAVAVQQIAGDEAYERAHNALMEMRGRFTLESLGKLAGELELEREAILDRMNTEAVTAVIRENRQLAEQMRISGTPTFVIGDEMIRGAPPQGLAAVVDAVRAEAEAKDAG